MAPDFPPTSHATAILHRVKVPRHKAGVFSCLLLCSEHLGYYACWEIIAYVRANIRLECDIASGECSSWILVRLIEPRDRLIGRRGTLATSALNSIALGDLNWWAQRSMFFLILPCSMFDFMCNCFFTVGDDWSLSYLYYFIKIYTLYIRERSYKCIKRTINWD